MAYPYEDASVVA